MLEIRAELIFDVKTLSNQKIKSHRRVRFPLNQLLNDEFVPLSPNVNIEARTIDSMCQKLVQHVSNNYKSIFDDNALIGEKDG